MAKLTLKKNGPALVPATKAAAIEFDKIKPGVPLIADVAQRRNIKFRRLYWGLCSYLAKALNAGPGEIEWTQSMVSDRLKLATGRAEITALPRSLAKHYNTPVAVRPASISFAKMDESEFSEFVHSAVRYVLTEFGEWVQGHEDWTHVQDILNHARKGLAA